jgi:hypothetical protein
VLQRVQAEFLLGYTQLINNDISSFDDYKDQIAAITVKPVEPPCASEPPRCNGPRRDAAPLLSSVEMPVASSTPYPSPAAPSTKTPTRSDRTYSVLCCCYLLTPTRTVLPCSQAALHYARRRARQRQLRCVELPVCFAS